jgi:hypothetical protein
VVQVSICGFQIWLHSIKPLTNFGTIMKKFLDKFFKRLKLKFVSHRGSAAYWTSHMVTTEAWSDAEDSLEFFMWRNAQYPGYIDLMPVKGADGLTVLDYGCGPGNDAISARKLAREHRDFLSAIKFDEYGHPIVGEYVAGINACFEFKKI